MAQYNFKVCYTNPQFLTTAGYGLVAHLPFLLDAKPAYHRHGSRYLIDRGLGKWVAGKPAGTTGTPPTPRSIGAYAAWLANFLEWSERRGIDLLKADYTTHVHGRYQSELQNGSWSRDGKGLSPATVNLYVDTACDYLRWLAAKGIRSTFSIPSITRTISTGSATSSTAHRLKTIESRSGKVRQSPRKLRIPNDQEVRRWLQTVYERKGKTSGLMCESVLMTAVRREELCCFRVDTLPADPVKWHVANPTAEYEHQIVNVTIRYGVKGPSYGSESGDKIGPEKIIGMPMHLAQKLHRYRTIDRPKLLAKWISGIRGAAAQARRREESVHMFLNGTGQRVKATQFFRAWKNGDMPFDEWSPHLGRHWWACSVLWREIKAHEQFNHTSGAAAAGALLAAVGKDIIRLTIQPQLGHINESITFVYLQWLADMIGVALPEQYQRHMLDDTPYTMGEV